MDFKKLKIELLQLLNDLDSFVDEIHINQVRYFIGYNELQLAMEFLTEYIYEDEIVLDNKMIGRINHFCQVLNIDKNYFLDINDQGDK